MTITVHCVGGPYIETCTIPREHAPFDDIPSEIYVVECEVLSWKAIHGSEYLKHRNALDVTHCSNLRGEFDRSNIYGRTDVSGMIDGNESYETGVYFIIYYGPILVLIRTLPVENYYELCESVDYTTIYTMFSLPECKLRELGAKARAVPKEQYGVTFVERT